MTVSESGSNEAHPGRCYFVRGPGYLLQDNLPISPIVLCSAMNYGAFKIILERAISSPAEVELTELDEAIRWVEERGTVRLLGRGADQDVYSQQFDAAAVEMRVLRRQLTSGQSASAQRVLTLLGREVSLLDLASSKRIDLWERGWNKLRQTPPQTHAIIKLSFRHVISILGVPSLRHCWP